MYLHRAPPYIPVPYSQGSRSWNSGRSEFSFTIEVNQYQETVLVTIYTMEGWRFLHPTGHNKAPPRPFGDFHIFWRAKIFEERRLSLQVQWKFKMLVSVYSQYYTRVHFCRICSAQELLFFMYFRDQILPFATPGAQVRDGMKKRLSLLS
jgi:hypothetical protein